MFVLKLFALASFSFFQRQVNASSQKKTLTVGGFYASGSKTTFQNASGVIKAVEMALREINSRPNVLAGYELKLAWQDTKCELNHGVTALFKHVYRPPTKIMLLGGICSAATQPVASVAALMNLVQISYGASSPALSDKVQYPLFFRTVYPEKDLNLAKVALLKHFGWKQVAILVEDEAFYTATATSLMSMLKENNIQVMEKENIDTNNLRPLMEQLKKKDSRIILALYSEQKAVDIFCEAYLTGLYGPKYVWILVAWYRHDWWNRNPIKEGRCTPEQVKTASGHYLSFSLFKDTSGALSKFSLTNETREQKWNALLENLGLYSGYAYDAVWAIALALNTSSVLLANENKTLEQFDYEDKHAASVIKQSLANVDFCGVTGRLHFNENGERAGSVAYIKQLQGNTTKMIGSYSVLERKLIIGPVPVIWEGGMLPRDGVTTVDKKVTISVSLFAAFCAMQSVGILLAVSFLVFNIYYSNHLYIKMSSPRLNNMIVLGIILLYCSGILNGIDGNFVGDNIESLLGCKLCLWLACIGFTLGFGAMFVKTWRVFMIFLHQNRKMAITDWQLFAIVAAFLVVDTIILTAQQLFDPMEIKASYTGERRLVESEDTIYKFYYLTCANKYSALWRILIYSVKGLLLSFGMFLAWQTRKVTVQALNDSRYIGFSVYNVVIPCAMGITILNTVKLSPNSSYAIESLLSVISTTNTLCLVFIPKINCVRQDPQGTQRPTFVPSLKNEVNGPQNHSLSALSPTLQGRNSGNI